MRTRKLQGCLFLCQSCSKKNPCLPERLAQAWSTPVCRSVSRRHGSPSTLAPASGSIFFRQPLHLSIRSRGRALCLNISFVSASVAGGYRSVIGLASGHSCLLFGPLASKRFSLGSCGLRLQFQSSHFRGLFFKYPLDSLIAHPNVGLITT